MDRREFLPSLLLIPALFNAYVKEAAGADVRDIPANTRKVISVKNFGAVGDGITDDSAAIQNAIDASAGKTIYFPPGTYIVNALQSVAVQQDKNHASPKKACLVMSSDMHLQGVAGASIIKAKSSISTDSVPQYFNMFMSNTHDTNVSFEGLTFDLNGQNNSVSPQRQTAWNRYHQAAIIWMSDKNNVARPDNLYIDNCIFMNCAGTTVIGTGFSITTPAAVADGVTITNCKFIDNGFDTDDHSSIYLQARHVLVDNNVFSIPSAPIIHQAVLEVHGPDQTITRNTVANYVQGIVVAAGDSGNDVFNVDISKNVIGCTYMCVGIYRNATGTLTNLYDVFIHDNKLSLTDTRNPFPAIPAAIYVFPTYVVRAIYIKNNQIQRIGGTVNNMIGIYLGNVSPGNLSDDIHIESNVIKRFTKGIFLPDLATTGSFGNLYITGNTILSSTDSVTPVANGDGIHIQPVAGQAITSLHLQGNRVITQSRIGIFLGGKINILSYADDNYITESGLQDYFEQSIDITTRTRVQH